MALFLAKLMRQAKPDDVFQFVTLATVRELWPRLIRYLGQSRLFWIWLLEPALEPPRLATIDDAAIAVDSMHEILTAKLTALLGRTELRDLVDVKALLDAGTDLAAALRDAPKKDDRPTGAGAGLDRRAGRRRRCVQAAVDRAVDPDRQTRLAPIQVGARLRNCLHGTRTRTNSS